MATQPELPPDAEVAEPGQMLTIGEHLVELRQRVTISVLMVLLTTVISLVFAKEVIDFLMEPGRDADPDFRPIFTELLGFLGAYIKVGLLLGMTASMPMLVYQLFAFVNPGLTGSERRWLIPIVILATVSFAGGGAFAFFVAWPPALDFLLNFGDDLADPQIRINNYIDMLTRFIFWSGVVFELPLILMGLGLLGLVTARRLIKLWRWAAIGSFVIAALITPSIDPVTQTTVAVPLLFLYVLGIALVKLVEGRALGASPPEEPEQP